MALPFISVNLESGGWQALEVEFAVPAASLTTSEKTLTHYVKGPKMECKAPMSCWVVGELLFLVLQETLRFPVSFGLDCGLLLYKRWKMKFLHTHVYTHTNPHLKENYSKLFSWSPKAIAKLREHFISVSTSKKHLGHRHTICKNTHSNR